MALFNLLTAAADNNLVVVKSIIEQGVDQDNLDQTLSCAVAYSHIELSKYLIERGAIIDWGDNDPVYQAAHNGEIGGVRSCLANGVDVNTQSGLILSVCAISTPADFIDWLIGQSADVNANQGKALVNAIVYQRLDNVQMLLTHGANPNLNQQQAVREAKGRIARGNQLTVDIDKLVAKASSLSPSD